MRNSTTPTPRILTGERADRVLARLRRRQLDAALRGRLTTSFHYARMATRVRKALGEAVPA